MSPFEVEQLGELGWFLRDDFAVEAARAAALLAERVSFVPAGLGRGGEKDPTVRSDETAWLDDSPLHPAFEQLRLELNRSAYLGLRRFDVQLARYALGTSYTRHRDALPGDDNRRVTAIVYLNVRPEGGELRLHTQPPIDVVPELGRLVVFLSNRVEHEVLKTRSVRYALTAWYYASPS